MKCFTRYTLISVLFLISFSEEMKGYEKDINILLSDTSVIVLPNDDFYLTKDQLYKDSIADFSHYKLDEFTRRKYGQTHFKYYIMQKLNFRNNLKSYLILEDYDSEMACWIANYTNDYQLIDSYEVFYDNAEGFRWTHSVIDVSKKTILIEDGSIYEDPEIKTIHLIVDDKGKFVEKENNN